MGAIPHRNGEIARDREEDHEKRLEGHRCGDSGRDGSHARNGPMDDSDPASRRATFGIFPISVQSILCLDGVPTQWLVIS